MIKVLVNKNNLERAIKEYKSKVIRTRQMSELNDRKPYQKPSEKRRGQILKASYVQKKFGNEKN